MPAVDGKALKSNFLNSESSEGVSKWEWKLSEADWLAREVHSQTRPITKASSILNREKKAAQDKAKPKAAANTEKIPKKNFENKIGSLRKRESQWLKQASYS